MSLVLLVGAGCSVVSPAAVSPQTPLVEKLPSQINPKLSDYIKKDNKFIIGYPNGWKVDDLQSNDTVSVVSFMSPEPEKINAGKVTEFGFKPNINVKIVPVKKDFDSEYADFRAANVDFSEAKITDEKREKISGGIVQFVTVRWPEENILTQARYGFYKRDGENYLYIVQGTGTAVGYSTKYGKLLEDSVASLRFE